jgi:hypothetical protein
VQAIETTPIGFRQSTAKPNSAPGTTASPERERHQRADRQRPVREGAGGVPDVRRLAVLAERAGNPDEHSDEQPRQRGGNEVAPVVPALADGDGEQVGERQYEELHARRDRQRAHDGHRDRRPLDAAHDHGDRAEERPGTRAPPT